MSAPRIFDSWFLAANTITARALTGKSQLRELFSHCRAISAHSDRQARRLSALKRPCCGRYQIRFTPLLDLF